MGTYSIVQLSTVVPVSALKCRNAWVTGCFVGRFGCCCGAPGRSRNIDVKLCFYLQSLTDSVSGTHESTHKITRCISLNNDGDVTITNSYAAKMEDMRSRMLDAEALLLGDGAGMSTNFRCEALGTRYYC